MLVRTNFLTQFQTKCCEVKNPQYTAAVDNLLGMNFGDVEGITITKNSRNQLIEFLIEYYKFHINGFKRPKSLDILNELFKNP